MHSLSMYSRGSLDWLKIKVVHMMLHLHNAGTSLRILSSKSFVLKARVFCAIMRERRYSVNMFLG